MNEAVIDPLAFAFSNGNESGSSQVDTTPLFTLMLCSGAAAGLSFAVPSKRFRAEAHSVPEGQALPFTERVVRAAVGVGLGVAAGLGHKERAADFELFSKFDHWLLLGSRVALGTPKIYKHDASPCTTYCSDSSNKGQSNLT